VEEEEEEVSSSEMTQSTRTTTLSTWGTREWKRRQTTQQRPRALTSPILLKTSKRRESGRRSKWSIEGEEVVVVGSGSGWILEVGSGRRELIFLLSFDFWGNKEKRK
jgi:hypothetical protein